MSKARELASLGNAYSDGALSNRNLIINGAMQVAQRGTVTNVGTTIATTYGGPDRFSAYSSSPSQSARFSLIQQSTGKSEFPSCFRLDCTTAASSSYIAAHEVKIEHFIEAQNLQGLQHGYSSAKPITLSFWVRSNQAATFAVWLFKPDSTRQTSKTYTISSADTWQYVTLTFDADTSGAIPSDNGLGLAIDFIAASGPSYTSGTSLNGAWEAIVNANRYVGHTATIGQSVNDYLDITGVSLEVGDTATPFEHRSYGQELALCQRYYEQEKVEMWGQMRGGGYTDAYTSFQYKTPKRTFPTVTLIGYTNRDNSKTPYGIAYVGKGGASCRATVNNTGYPYCAWELHYSADCEL